MIVDDTDDELIVRAVAGDRAGFSALISRHYDMIFRVAWKWCGNREDAEDIAQEVCIRLARTLGSYSRQSRFSTWLYRVVLNAVKDHQRRVTANLKKLDAWANEPERAVCEAPHDLTHDDPVEQLWAAVRQLPDRQRDSVLLVFGEGLTHGEAATAMECAEGTVSSNIHDAKKRLKILMIQEADN